MKRFAATLCAALIALFALGTVPALAGNPAVDMLEKAQAKMKELAEKDLPNQNLGKPTQDKEEIVIQTLDEIIRMILDDKAKQGPDDGGPPIPPDERPGPPRGPDEKVKPGEVNGNIFGNGEPDRKPGEEWGGLPQKDFKDTPRDSDVPTIPGYEKIVERYRAVKSENQNKVDE